MKTKLTQQDLANLHEIAIQVYKDEAPGQLSQSEFRAKCFLIASLTILEINDTIEFPERKNTESIMDD